MGIRCALHAEGDGAVRKTIDIYEKCQKVNGKRDSRHVITDLEMVRTEDLKRMAGPWNHRLQLCADHQLSGETMKTFTDTTA